MRQAPDDYATPIPALCAVIAVAGDDGPVETIELAIGEKEEDVLFATRDARVGELADLITAARNAREL